MIISPVPTTSSESLGTASKWTQPLSQKKPSKITKSHVCLVWIFTWLSINGCIPIAGWFYNGKAVIKIDDLAHDGSMVLLYMVTWIPSIYPSHVSIYIYIPAPWILWVGVITMTKRKPPIIAIDGLCGALCPSALGRKLLSLPGGTELNGAKGKGLERRLAGWTLVYGSWFSVVFFVPM